jgi:hypothetical protein
MAGRLEICADVRFGPMADKCIEKLTTLLAHPVDAGIKTPIFGEPYQFDSKTVI